MWTPNLYVEAMQGSDRPVTILDEMPNMGRLDVASVTGRTIDPLTFARTRVGSPTRLGVW